MPLLKKIKSNKIKKENFHTKLIIKNKRESKVMMSFKHIIQNQMLEILNKITNKKVHFIIKNKKIRIKILSSKKKVIENQGNKKNNNYLSRNQNN